MIIPTAADVVRTLSAEFEKTIIPVLDKPLEKSTAQTMRHLLRFLEYRIEDEGQILLDEVIRLNDNLEKAASHFEAQAAGTSESHPLAAAIRKTLAEQQDPKIYPSLTLMAKRVSVMRQHVCDALAELQKTKEQEGSEAIHNLLKEYIVWQIEQEGKMVKPAFWGHGPKR